MKYLKYYYNKMATMSYTALACHSQRIFLHCTGDGKYHHNKINITGMQKGLGTNNIRSQVDIYLQALIDSTLMTLSNGVWSLGSC